MKNLSLNIITKCFQNLVLALVLVISLSSCADHVHLPIRGYLDNNKTNINQIIKTKGLINIYDRASLESPVVDQIEYGYMLHTETLEDTEWAKVVKDREVIGYIQTEHLTTKKIYNKGGSYTQFPLFNYLRPVNFLVFIIYAIAIFSLMNIFNSQQKYDLFDSIIYDILFPLLCIIYFANASDPLWVCRPSIVSWFLAIPMFILTVVMASNFFGVVISGIKSLILIFADPLNGLINLAITILSGYAFMGILSEIIVEFTWIIFALMISSTGGLTYLGTFTSRNGNKVDIFG